MFLLKMLGEVCPVLVQDSRVCVCAVWCKHGKGGACLVVRWGCSCVYMVCVRAVKTKVRVSVLVAWSSGRSIWLLEISNLLPRHRPTVQRMYSKASDSQARWVYCARAVHFICRCIVKYVGFQDTEQAGQGCCVVVQPGCQMTKKSQADEEL